MVNKIIKATGIHPTRVKNIIGFGSQVYGTNSEESDHDFMAICASMNEHREIKTDDLNIHVVTPEFFQKGIELYKMTHLECLFAPEHFVLLGSWNKPFKINNEKLVMINKYKSFESWALAKERMERGDIHRGRKSAFHALRILDFCVQIENNGKIVDFSSCNFMWDQLSSMNSWEEIKENFFPLKLELEKSVYLSL